MRTFIVLTALLMGIPAFGSWDDQSWPSDTSYRINSPTNYLVKTNYWGKEHVEIWTATSSTNTFPANVTNTVPGYTPFIVLSTNAPADEVWTNTFWTDIQTDVPSNTWSTWGSTNTITNVTEWVTIIETNTFVTNTITIEVYRTVEPVNIEWDLDVQWIWAFDTHQSLEERWRVLDWVDTPYAVTVTNTVPPPTTTNTYYPRSSTNDFVPSGPNDLKPTLYKDERVNLVNFKDWIESNMDRFVDINYATNDSLDAYFETPSVTNWVWTDTDEPLDGTNDTWVSEVVPPSTFPLVSENTFTNIQGYPYELYTRPTIVNSTFGWEVGEFTTEATNVRYVVYDEVITNSWFSYTPYRDLGGWGSGLSNEVDGQFVFDVWFEPYMDGTNLITGFTNRIGDSCAAIPNSVLYDYSMNSLTNTNGVVTNVTFSLDRVTEDWVDLDNFTFTNATFTYTNVVDCVTSEWLFVEGDWGVYRFDEYYPTNACNTTAPYTLFYGADVFIVSDSNNFEVYEYTEVFLYDIFSQTTNLFEDSYTNRTLITNELSTCTNDYIAFGFDEGDYGYAMMTGVVAQLVWTAEDYQLTNSALRTELADEDLVYYTDFDQVGTFCSTNYSWATTNTAPEFGLPSGTVTTGAYGWVFGAEYAINESTSTYEESATGNGYTADYFEDTRMDRVRTGGSLIIEYAGDIVLSDPPPEGYEPEVDVYIFKAPYQAEDLAFSNYAIYVSSQGADSGFPGGPYSGFDDCGFPFFDWNDPAPVISTNWWEFDLPYTGPDLPMWEKGASFVYSEPSTNWIIISTPTNEFIVSTNNDTIVESLSFSPYTPSTNTGTWTVDTSESHQWGGINNEYLMDSNAKMLLKWNASTNGFTY